MQLKFEDRFLGEVAVKELKDLKGKLPYPFEVLKAFKRRIYQITNAKNTADLRNIGGLHFEKLKEPRYKGKYSIKLDIGYRLIFRIENNEVRIEIIFVEEITNHYS
jgi:proteic killer suppression protein